jgi:hypothetical protein
MLGRFLEISVPCAGVARSLAYYQALGFTELLASDTFRSEYAVVSDGRLCIGLHGQDFARPMLTFVYPNLARHALTLADIGIAFTFTKLAEDQFNEVGFEDVDGNLVSLQEARSFSPPEEDVQASALGDWLELSLPVRDLPAAARYWAPLAPSILTYRESPPPHLRFDAAGAPMGLTLSEAVAKPSLGFVCTDRGRLMAILEARQIELEADPGFEGAFGRLMAPEGTSIFLFDSDFAAR